MYLNKSYIEKQFIEDKYSRLDVKATISNNETIAVKTGLTLEEVDTIRKQENGE